MIKHIIIISGLAVSLTATQAQYVKNYKKAADKFYKQGDYNSAAQYYEKSLAGNKNVQNGYEPYLIEKKETGALAKGASPKVALLYNLADCYFKLQDYSHAET
jgi:tetratricopeptide (TPR) repeat protein